MLNVNALGCFRVRLWQRMYCSMRLIDACLGRVLPNAAHLAKPIVARMTKICFCMCVHEPGVLVVYLIL